MNNNSEKEDTFLLGFPNFTTLINNRLKCVETGHELPEKERESYSKSKACRTALIDFFVANKKAPLNLFRQCPISKMKLVCEVTGDSINKSEEHIWKHINGKRFLNKLEEKEMGTVASIGKLEKRKILKNVSKASLATIEEDKMNEADKNAYMGRNFTEMDSDSDEPDFWMPPVGERWDFDVGEDRWEGSIGLDDDIDEDGIGNEVDEQRELESIELSTRTKRMSIAVGPSSFASQKKKTKG